MSSTTQTLTMQRGEAGSGPGLLVIEPDSSRVLTLNGELVAGRAPECGLVLTSDGVSRRHARFNVRGQELEVEDLGSHNGTFVNGARVAGVLRLEAGDLVEVGGVGLIVHGVPERQGSSRVVPYPQLLARFEEGLAVCLRTGAPLAVAALQFSPAAAPPDVLRELERALEPGDLAASYGWDQVIVLLGNGGDPVATAGRLVEAFGRADPGARVGVAAFPRDGARGEALLLAARDAARQAAPGAIATPSEAAREFVLGDRAVLVADPAMRQVYALLGRVANSALPVLVTGETGAGKENAAFAVHHLSKRASKPFVTLNCAAVQETLAESELFGHEKGAFTGATGAREGLFQAADGGTLFLDEVGELSATVQAKLLRVLENHTVTRVGGTRELPVDVRIVAATNRDLEKEVAEGRFRKDLFFRLSVAVVVLPPLRSRPAEIALLSRRLLEQACKREGRAPMEIGASAMDALCRYRWEGNVRELKNTMDVVAATLSEPVVEAWHLPERVQGERAVPREGASAAPRAAGFKPLADELAELEQRRIVEALERTKGVQSEAAELLGMPRRTLVFKLRRLRAEGALPAAFRGSAD